MLLTLHLEEPQLSVNPFSDLYLATVGPSKMFLCYSAPVTGDAGLLSSDSDTVAWQKRALQRRDRKNYLFYDSRHSKSPVTRPENGSHWKPVKGYLDGRPEVDYGASRTRFR